MTQLTKAPTFNLNEGSLALGLFVLWLIVLGAAAFWLRMKPQKNAARMAFRKRTAIVLLVIAGLGVVNSLAGMFGVPVVEWSLWGLILFLILVIFSIYAFWDARTRLPARAASSGRAVREAPKHITAPGTVSPGSSVNTQPRPEATTGRRDARRAKKRKR